MPRPLAAHHRGCQFVFDESGLSVSLLLRRVQSGDSSNREQRLNEGNGFVFIVTLSLLYFQLPSTFLPSKGRSITTLGTRRHDFFLLPFLDILYFCFIFIAFLFLSLRDADSKKGTLCPFCVPILRKKKTKKNRSTYNKMKG